MKKITETELKNSAQRLRSYLSILAEETAPPAPTAADLSGNGVKATVTPQPAAPTGPANAKEQNYATALQQIKGLYAKAQVAYPPQDDIVRQRFGLPPALPPIDQWDGKMPEAGQADWMTRNILGRDATKAVASQQATNTTSNTANAKADAETAADLPQLKALVDKLKTLLVPPSSSVSISEPTIVKEDIDKYDLSSKVDSLRKRLDEAWYDPSTWFNKEAPAPTPAPAPAPAAPAAPTAPAELPNDKPGLIKAIQDLIAKINGNNENPPADVAQALNDAQAALDAAKAAQEAEANAVPPSEVSTPTGTNTATAYKGSTGSQALQKLNPEIKDVNKIFAGQKIKLPDGSEDVVQAGDTLDKIAARNNIKETVGYSDEQILARIVDLAHR
jgi:LysM repeat protein